MDWFERLTGFRETTYQETKARLRAARVAPRLAIGEIGRRAPHPARSPHDCFRP